jgi:hypothetical protein|nr:MAG TPA: hypothetical protein [Caudoviricetes sp.]
MTNKLYDSKGQLIGYIRTVEKNLHDDLTRVILSTGHELAFCPGDLTSDRDGNWRIRSGALYPRCEGKKTASATNTAAIKDVIFAPPATIVYWSDGSKTVVKCSEKDVFDPEKGLAMAIAKRCGGNKGGYYKEIQNWVEKSGKKYPGKPAAGKAVDLDVLKKYSSEANKDFEKFLSAAKSNNQSGALLHLTALVADLKILEIEISK